MNARKTDGRVLIVGGGPAGMMAAITAAERGRPVILLEHGPAPGRKLRITGKGRCNVCNRCDQKTVLAHVHQNAKFLYGALHRFPPEAVMAFFEASGVPLKTERGNRVFPVSDRAQDIVAALERRMWAAGVQCRNRTEVRAVLAENNRVTGVRTETGTIAGSHVLIATGGCSYPLTGSTGDGFSMAEALGHTVTPPRPSLAPLVCSDPDCGELQGFSLRNVVLSAYDRQGGCLFSELGEMMFTHFGVTGPLVLSASARMSPEAGPFRLEIDLKPGLDAEKLDARILRDFEKYKNREFQNALNDLTGRAMIPVLVRRSGIPPETRVHSITKTQRRNLVSLLKSFPLSVSGVRGFAEAIVTAGGVKVGEVDPRTMQSKRIAGLYFAGEVLDLDADTGGFNLQIAWSTGYTAGLSL